MRLTLRQRNHRDFKVFSQRKEVHSFELPNDVANARERIWEIIDETKPTEDPILFHSFSHEAMSALGRGFEEKRSTSFYCGSVCLTLE